MLITDISISRISSHLQRPRRSLVDRAAQLSSSRKAKAVHILLCAGQSILPAVLCCCHAVFFLFFVPSFASSIFNSLSTSLFDLDPRSSNSGWQCRPLKLSETLLRTVLEYHAVFYTTRPSTIAPFSTRSNTKSPTALANLRRTAPARIPDVTVRAAPLIAQSCFA